MVQDLRAVNEIVVPTHSIVPNPYILHTQVSGDVNWFAVLDLKDPFFCIPLNEELQPLFVFEWAYLQVHTLLN